MRELLELHLCSSNPEILYPPLYQWYPREITTCSWYQAAISRNKADATPCISGPVVIPSSILVSPTQTLGNMPFQIAPALPYLVPLMRVGSVLYNEEYRQLRDTVLIKPDAPAHALLFEATCSFFKSAGKWLCTPSGKEVEDVKTTETTKTHGACASEASESTEQEQVQLLSEKVNRVAGEAQQSESTQPTESTEVTRPIDTNETMEADETIETTVSAKPIESTEHTEPEEPFKLPKLTTYTRAAGIIFDFVSMLPGPQQVALTLADLSLWLFNFCAPSPTPEAPVKEEDSKSAIWWTIGLVLSTWD